MAKDITTITETTTLDDTDVFHVGTDLAGTPTDKRITLLNLKGEVIDSTAVDGAGAVMETDFDANTMLLATADDTPVASTATQVRSFLNVEDGADVTDATNVNAAGATMNTDTDVSSNSWVLDEDDMNSDDNTKVPTQQSVKAYVDGIVHDAVTVTDSSEMDFTLTGQDITASIKSGSIDETKLDTSVNASLDLADSALQSGDNISELTNNSGYLTGNETITVSGDATGSGTTSIGLTIADGVIEYANLSAVMKALVDEGHDAMQDLVDDTTPTLGGDLDAADKNVTGLGSVGFTQELDNGSKSASFTVDFSTDQKQKVTLTANTMTMTLDTTNVKVGNYMLTIVNGGLATLTWASESGSIYAPSGTAPELTASGIDVVALKFDGTDWMIVGTLDFQTI